MQEQSHPEFVFVLFGVFQIYSESYLPFFCLPEYIRICKKKNLNQILKLADFLIIINQIQ